MKYEHSNIVSDSNKGMRLFAAQKHFALPLWINDNIIGRS